MRRLAFLLVALPGSAAAALFGTLFAGEVPSHVGRGTLAPCPPTPNCVSSLAAGEQAVAPFRYAGDPAQAMQRLATAAATLPGARVASARPDYLHVEAASRVMGFVDDLEAVPAADGVIHVRSASRLGRSDFGVNRARVEALREAFAASTP
jgi:uncharacterized protein (DUF1499 family)